MKFGTAKEIITPIRPMKIACNGVFDKNYKSVDDDTYSCAYIVDDKILEEGGYEPTCHLEYGLIGPFKKGLNKLYTGSFKKAFEEISK